MNGFENIQSLQMQSPILGETKEVTAVVAPSQTLARFCPVALKADGTICKYDTDSLDENLHVIYGLIGEDVTTGAGETAKALVYVVGIFDVKAVSTAFGEDMPARSYNFGNIILKEVK